MPPWCVLHCIIRTSKWTFKDENGENVRKIGNLYSAINEWERLRPAESEVTWKWHLRLELKIWICKLQQIVLCRFHSKPLVAFELGPSELRAKSLTTTTDRLDNEELVVLRHFYFIKCPSLLGLVLLPFSITKRSLALPSSYLGQNISVIQNYLT